VGNTSFCPSDSSEEENCFATFAKSPFWQFGYLAISSGLNIFCSSFIEFESRKLKVVGALPQTPHYFLPWCKK
jgi:hypothetical protein